MADEAQALRTSLPPDSDKDQSLETTVGRALLAREGDAVWLDGRLSGDFNPQVLRLLHRAATDPRTSTEQASALRRYALEVAGRLMEERRTVLRAYLQMICRVADAHVTSSQRGEDPQKFTVPLYRAMSLSAQRITTINMEILGAVPGMVPTEVAAEIRHAYHEQAFKAISRDVSAFSSVAALALPQLAGDALAQSTAEIQANTLARWRLLDDLGREFGEEQLRCFGRARVRDRAAGDRFLRRLALVQDRALAEAQETLARLRARALDANPGWDTAAFDQAVSAWRAQVVARRDQPLLSGHLMDIVAPDQIEQVLPGRGRGSRESAR